MSNHLRDLNLSKHIFLLILKENVIFDDGVRVYSGRNS
jgi:hypothetical protein